MVWFFCVVASVYFWGVGDKITLVQVSCSEQGVFIFDVLTQPGLVEGLRGVLEEGGIVKVYLIYLRGCSRFQSV